MSIDSLHPHYEQMFEDWELMRDAVAGERVVKSKGPKYLPPTEGHNLDGYGKAGSTGQRCYDAYKARAVYHDFPGEAVESYIGLLHQKPATFELPDGMEDLLTKASSDGESLQALLRRINAEQLTTGRVGLLLDFPKSTEANSNPMPWIAVYNAESIINWDNSDDNDGVNSLNLVVLNESGPVRFDEFQWKDEEKYRVLKLGQATDSTFLNTGISGLPVPSGNIYMQGVFKRNDSELITPDAMMAPSVRGKQLDQIPFVFINSKDIVPTPDKPPLIGLGRLAMAIYRGEADYRHTLFMQGQDTLVTIGGVIDPNGFGRELDPLSNDGAIRTGANARIDLNLGGDAKYIGIGAQGLSEQREALKLDKSEAKAKAGQLISPSAGKQESGDALTTRLAAQTATLNQLALCSALGLENILKIAAIWMGKDPEKVKVTPNLEFVKQILVPKDAVELMSARSMGAPISLKSIHNYFVNRELTKMSYEDELAQIEDEDMSTAKAQASIYESVGLGPTGQLMPDEQPKQGQQGGKPRPGTQGATSNQTTGRN